jgi:hypothetical protein
VNGSPELVMVFVMIGPLVVNAALTGLLLWVMLQPPARPVRGRFLARRDR